MALDRATFGISEESLQYMVLEKSDMPEEFQGFQVVREGPLDNETMAQHGFQGNTPERFRTLGRVTGFMRELGETSNAREGFNFLGATVAHLFDNPKTVTDWMHEVFIKDFEANIGESVGEDQQLISTKRLETSGFFDEAVALKVLQGGTAGLVSSTVLDFRVGRILGVAFVGTVGDHERLDLATQLAQSLERQIVKVVLGAV
ncbi:MAG: hypothetical protein VX947_01385 [Chloroflexota bacterium]|nr:hypothetical protein [Chloroflexota bacterium]